MPANLPFLHLSGEFEEVHYFADAKSGLKAIVVLHDTSLGPALGGIRCIPYASEQAALVEALDLARGMTYKCLLAELPAGGGKAVIIDHPGLDRRAAFERLGEHVEQLGGRFFTAADLGTTERDLKVLGRTTRYVAIPEHGVDEDLGSRTAEGVFIAAGTALDLVGHAEWGGVRLAIQGLGSIGLKLAMRALRAGAKVVACDVNAERAGRATDTVPVKLVEPDQIWDEECDVFAPCAGSRGLDEKTIPRLHCRLVCGAANNQLATIECGDLLAERGILYAPDLLVNAGAVIMGCGQALPDFERPDDLTEIGHRLRSVLIESLTKKVSPHRLVLARAEQKLRDARAKRRPSAASAR